MNLRPAKLTCLLFFVILAAPFFLTLMGVELTTPLKENRVREKLPELSKCSLSRMDTCYQQLDSWFNDNYGPRDLLIKLKTQIDYSVFSTSDKVHIGSDDWLYYRSTLDVEKVAGERLPDVSFKKLLADFDALDRYLQSRNIQLVVLPIPLKDVIYAENLPRSSPNLPANSRYQKLRNWLAGHESILTVDAFELLNRRKLEARAFHKTDFHWNDPAGFLCAKALVNLLWQHQTGESSELWIQELTIKQELFSGGQARFLPLVSAPKEQGLFLDVGWLRSQGTHVYQSETDLWNYTYDGTGDDRGRLDTAVIVGDSFFDAMHRAEIDTYFSSVYRARANPERLAEIYANLPQGTRYFVFEFIESKIFSLAVFGLSVPSDHEGSPTPATPAAPASARGAASATTGR